MAGIFIGYKPTYLFYFDDFLVLKKSGGMKTFIENHADVEVITKQFDFFLNGLSAVYEDKRPQEREEITEYLKNVTLWDNQFVYIHHIKSGSFFFKGIDKCLGYEMDELHADFFIRNVHPADLTMYFKISKALLSFVMDNSEGLVPFNSSFLINYRIKTVKGDYIQVLRQSTPFIKDANGKVEAYISMCSNITEISESNCVKWNISGPKKENFPKYLNEQGEDEHLFSGRELDILRLLSNGRSSQAIADKLFISINTVNTHRKSLMRKANVNKTIDLLAFALDHGYL